VCHPRTNVSVSASEGPVQPVSALAEPHELLDLLSVRLGAPPNKGPAGRLGLGRTLDKAPVRRADLPKDAGDNRYARAPRPGNNRLGVLLRRHVHNGACASAEKGVQYPLAPVVVEVAMPVHGELGLHLQSIEHHAIKRAENPVHSRDNPQVTGEPPQLAGGHDLRRKVLVLDAHVREDGGGEQARFSRHVLCHCGKPLPVGAREGVAAAPDVSCPVVAACEKLARKALGVGEKRWARLGKGRALHYVHELCRRDYEHQGHAAPFHGVGL
jgi:hypothetical protein